MNHSFFNVQSQSKWMFLTDFLVEWRKKSQNAVEKQDIKKKEREREVLRLRVEKAKICDAPKMKSSKFKRTFWVVVNFLRTINRLMAKLRSIYRSLPCTRKNYSRALQMAAACNRWNCVLESLHTKLSVCSTLWYRKVPTMLCIFFSILQNFSVFFFASVIDTRINKCALLLKKFTVINFLNYHDSALFVISVAYIFTRIFRIVKKNSRYLIYLAKWFKFFKIISVI